MNRPRFTVQKYTVHFCVTETEFWKTVFFRIDGRKALSLEKSGNPHWRDRLADSIVRVELESSDCYV